MAPTGRSGGRTTGRGTTRDTGFGDSGGVIGGGVSSMRSRFFGGTMRPAGRAATGTGGGAGAAATGSAGASATSAGVGSNGHGLRFGFQRSRLRGQPSCDFRHNVRWFDVLGDVHGLRLGMNERLGLVRLGHG